jgi:AhpD family alkylhydroperoxidase
MSTDSRGFTLEAVEWDPWVETFNIAEASPEQLAVLDESSPNGRTSTYYTLLIHDLEALRERSRLFKAVMYGPGGLPRAERELATVATSRINGCPYCASVHSRLFVQLRKSEGPRPGNCGVCCQAHQGARAAHRRRPGAAARGRPQQCRDPGCHPRGCHVRLG